MDDVQTALLRAIASNGDGRAILDAVTENLDWRSKPKFGWQAAVPSVVIENWQRLPVEARLVAYLMAEVVDELRQQLMGEDL